MDVLEHCLRLRQMGRSHVLVTVVAARGSTPQDVGAKMVVTDTGRETGTVGGGRIEAAAIEYAQKLLTGARAERLVKWNLQRDIGMTCGGEMQLYFDVCAGSSAWPIAIFGAGHVAQALVPVLAPLDCRLFCFDTRADWIARLPKAANVLAETRSDPAAAVREIPAASFVLILTQGHATDLPVLKAVLEARSFPFIGVIGSRSKRATLERELRESGLPDELVSGFECPLGLPIGGNHPQEIAISIAAGLLKTRDERAATR